MYKDSKFCDEQTTGGVLGGSMIFRRNSRLGGVATSSPRHADDIHQFAGERLI